MTPMIGDRMMQMGLMPSMTRDMMINPGMPGTAALHYDDGEVSGGIKITCVCST